VLQEQCGRKGIQAWHPKCSYCEGAWNKTSASHNTVEWLNDTIWGVKFSQHWNFLCCSYR
jgi:hypothetical protein